MNAGATLVQISAWRCLCARCGHEWEALAPAHGLGKPPARCARCKALNWGRPAAYVVGRGKSPRSVARRRAARAARAGK